MEVTAGLNLFPFGTKELSAQVVHLGSAASNHIEFTYDKWMVVPSQIAEVVHPMTVQLE